MILTTSDMSMVGDILDFNLRNAEHFTEWEDKKSPDYYTREYHRFLVRNEREEMKNNSGFVLYLTDKKTGRIIGRVAVFGMLGGNCSFCTLGYKLDRDWQHMGYMHEALKEVIGILFDEMDMHRLEVYILPKNEKSINVVKRLGFKQEGIAEKYMRIFGRWEDHLRFVMLREDRQK